MTFKEAVFGFFAKGKGKLDGVDYFNSALTALAIHGFTAYVNPDSLSNFAPFLFFGAELLRRHYQGK